MPVKILDPQVIAKIAAGEVVERPASVIKELIENSLDAGASSIEIHLKDAGKELIHIKDNGSGITKEDLGKIFQRHATSKIQNIEDLEKLSSMGFRGEALYSIAAVSHTLLRSKTSSQDAWEIQLQAGERLDLKPAALSTAGTEIKITQLFFNTPARRKFLKSSTAEVQQILNVVLPFCLLYPDRRFELTHAGRVLVDVKPATSAIDRMAEILNIQSAHFMEATQDFSELGARVRVLLSNINVQRPRRDLQYIFVNQRPVESKSLNYNINDVYRMILPPGVYPAYLLDIQIDPADVDVNIHPTKREVRIRQEARLISFVRHLVEYTLMQQGQVKQISSGNNQSGQMPQSLFNPSINDPKDIVFNPNEQQSFSTTPAATLAAQRFDASHWQSAPVELFANAPLLQDRFGRSRYIGSFMNKYLIFEEAQTLFLVDQHAAQERIMFERFERQINKGTIEIQPLLTPLLLKLSPLERVAWDEIQDKLTEVGIETSLFDDDTLAIQSQPLLLKNIEKAVRILLSGDDISRCDRTTIARRACKASIVTGDRLDASQVDYQRKQLLACQDPFTCPHGRPTVVELKESFLDKQFLRT